MAFTSFTYLYFLAIVVALYWIVRNRKAQNILLLVASYVFYGWLTPWYCALLASCTVVTYICLRLVWNAPPESQKRKLPIAFAIAFNVGLLCILKYWNFWAEDVAAALQTLGLQPSADVLRVALPIGLSFYTLQAIGLAVDASRGDVGRQSLLDVALFLSFFPKLIAGPFEPAKSFLSQSTTDRRLQLTDFAGALPLLLSGYLKKLVVAENISVLIAQTTTLEQPSLLIMGIGLLGFSIQILADFSGYTDIARGSARLMGFQLMENFNYPYFAISPSDFWKRWHISLSRWFTHYVYIPLGGSRNGTARMCLALMLTMLASGAWHGATANFVIWGGYWGTLLCVYHLLRRGGDWRPATRTGAVFAWAIMSAWTAIGWAIFWMPEWQWSLARTALRKQDMLAASVLSAAIAIYLVPWIVNHLGEKSSRFSSVLRPVCRGLSICALLIWGVSSPDDFIYFSF